MPDPTYLQAGLAEFEAVPAWFIAGPDEDARLALVRCFTDPNVPAGLRLTIEHRASGLQAQLVVDAADFQRIVIDPQSFRDARGAG